MSNTTTERIRWSEAEVTILKQEVEKADTKEAAFNAIAALLGKTPNAVAQKWGHLQSKGKPKTGTKQVIEKVKLPKQKLSTGMQLMQQTMGAEMTASRIILTPTSMLIEF